MVPLSERDAVTRRAKADTEMRAVYAFLFEEPYDFATESAFPHAALLRSVVEKDTTAFHTQVADFTERRASENSGWYENDSLIFLLLLGCERLQVDPSFLEQILTARERNTNPVPKRVNEVFRSLSRKDYGMESPYSFIKLPLLHLAGDLTLSNEAAAKVYRELTSNGAFNQLSPFMQLLALRAYDIILFERRPQPYENFGELVKAVETVHEKASVRQAIQLLCALPYKWWLGAIPTAVIILTFVFGWGQRALDRRHEAAIARSRPTAVVAAAEHDALNDKFAGVQALARQAIVAVPNSVAAAIEISPFAAPTPKFSVEMTTAMTPIISAQVWLIHRADGGSIQSLLPIQQNPSTVRVFVPVSDVGDYLLFVLIVRPTSGRNPSALMAEITVRALD